MIEAKKEELPDDVELKVGEQIIIVMKDNTEAPAKIIEIADEKVTLDANHPLAGKDLIFELELVEVNPAGQAAPSN